MRGLYLRARGRCSLNWCGFEQSLCSGRAVAALLCTVVMLAACAVPGVGEPEQEVEQEAPLLDIRLFFEDPRYSAARISPDGEYIAFMKPYNGGRNIWIKGIDEPFDKARPLTGYERSIATYFWSRDGESIVYMQDRYGDENYQIRALNPHDDAADEGDLADSWQLAGDQGVRAVIYHVPREKPEVVFVGLNDRDPRYHDVYQVEIASGDKEKLARNEVGIESWHFHEGQLRKASRTTSDGGSEILSFADGEFQQVYSCDFGESCRVARFHPDGERVYLVTNAGEERDLSELVLFDPRQDEEELVDADPEGEVDLDGAIFSEVDDRLLATTYFGDKQRIYAHDEGFAEKLEWLREQLGESELSFTSRTSDESQWTVGAARDTDPGTVYVFDADQMNLDKLYAGRPELPNEHLAPMRPIRYSARDGEQIPAYLTLPPGSDGEDLPVVVNPHGGPWLRDKWGYSGTVQFLANRGYAVLQPNFRGSAGYGKEFLNAGNREWGTGVMQHDITDGVKYLIDEGIADPDRVAIYGGSYGGFATLAGLAFTPELYAAGVSVVGPSNIITLIETFPPYWEPGMERLKRRVGDPKDEQDRERLKEQSPLFAVDQMRSPLLVVHGANDPRVAQRESDQIVAALRDAGHPVEYLVAPDEGHGFVDELNRLAYLAATERFLAKHIGGRYQGEYDEAIEGRLEELRVDINEVEVDDGE
ncbi:S9 family peptidase [Halorhodospira halochloris]|nr:S9 family peptidase [Halorhodospira halochloris]